jgi:hypothetical protein
MRWACACGRDVGDDDRRVDVVPLQNRVGLSAVPLRRGLRSRRARTPVSDLARHQQPQATRPAGDQHDSVGEVEGAETSKLTCDERRPRINPPTANAVLLARSWLTLEWPVEETGTPSRKR